MGLKGEAARLAPLPGAAPPAEPPASRRGEDGKGRGPRGLPRAPTSARQPAARAGARPRTCPRAPGGPFVAETPAPGRSAPPRGTVRAAPPPPRVRYRPRASTRRRRARAGRGHRAGEGRRAARRAAGVRGLGGAHLPVGMAAPASARERRQRRAGKRATAVAAPALARSFPLKPAAAAAAPRRPSSALWRREAARAAREAPLLAEAASVAPGLAAAPRRVGGDRGPAVGAGGGDPRPRRRGPVPDKSAPSAPGWAAGLSL